MLVLLTIFVIIGVKIILFNTEPEPDGYLIDTENIFHARTQPGNEQNIFFIESSDTQKVILNARQACAVESAALTNPHLKVFVLIESHEKSRDLLVTDQVEALLSYQNVFIAHFNMYEMSVGSPLEEFIWSNKLSTSRHKTEHSSDVFRLLLLWKYGGTYLDFDMIVRSELDKFRSNYACPESDIYVDGAILNFDTKEGRNLTEVFIRNLLQHYDPKDYCGNGPTLITRVLKELCKADDLTEMTKMSDCHGFHVLDRKICYAIIANDWKRLWATNTADEVMSEVEESLVVHFWNSRSKKKKISVDSSAPYIQLARQFCPKVLETVKEFF